MVINRACARLALWLEILLKINGTNFKMELGLIFSALKDLLFYLIHPSLASLPKVYVSGVVYLRKYNVYFYVRGFSDDLYSVMPRREGDVNDLILKSLEKGDVFVDVGANVGYYSVLGAKIVGDKGHVISIEPVPNTVEVLRLNIKLNNLGNINVVRKAAWSSRSLVDMYLPKGYYGWVSLFQWDSLYRESITVEAIPLDSICKGLSQIKLLKIDAQGSEYQILQGAEESLKATKLVILELSKDCGEILRLLKEASFEIRKLIFGTHIYACKKIEE